MKLFATLFLSFSVFISTASAQENSPKSPGLSPATRQYIAEVSASGHARPHGYIYKTGFDGKEYMSALIKVSNATGLEEKLKSFGAVAGTKAGNIWTVDVPVNQFINFTKINGIGYIQLDEPVLMPHLDVARRTTRVDSVHKGINLPMVYSGKDVVVGVIDFGFDYNHPTFYDTLGSKYRVTKVWEMNGSGTPPAGQLFGSELGDTTTIKAHTTDNVEQTHGTSTAGMAAGSGWGSNGANNKFRGMAYDAQLVLVGVRRDSIGGQWLSGSFTDFVKGIDYIFKYAASQGKPAVVNISWGSQSGPHDGSSLFNQACNNLSGAGKLIVMSAGNEGSEHIHLSKAFTAVDTAIRTFLTFNPNTYRRTWVDIWGETGKTFAGRVKLYKNGAPIGSTPNIPLDNSIHNEYIIGSNGGDTCIVQFINSLAEYNGKPRMTLNIWNKTTDTVRVELAGNSGTVHLWNEYYYFGYEYGYQGAFSSLGDPTATSGDTLYTVSDMGAASSVLLVGAYASKTSWTSLGGNPFGYNATYAANNRLVSFSSRGPLVGGTTKPDITAPGVTIATSTNSYDTAYSVSGSRRDYLRATYVFPATGRTYYYGEFSGTSASAPAAAGIVALMLQVNPLLTPQMAQNVIYQTAIQDQFTGALPLIGDNGWGHGKINAYGAIKKLVQAQGIYTYTGKKLDCVLFPNPNTGKFTLDYTGNAPEALDVELVEVTGRKVASFSWNVSSGQNLRSFDLGEIAKGTYLVKVAGKNGSMNVKLVVQ